MRIALVSREYPPETAWGGIGTYTQRLGQTLAADGHDVRVVSRSERSEEYVVQDGRVTVHRIRERKLRCPGRDALYHLLPFSEWFYSRRVAEKIGELHRQTPFDIIEAPEYRAEAYHLVRQQRLPIVIKLHSPSFVINQVCGRRPSLREWVVNWMECTTAHRATAISAPSSDLVKRVVRAWKVERHRIHLILNPTDSVATGEPWPGSEVLPTVLFVGRVEHHKGVHVLSKAIVGALREVPTARFILVGVPGDKTVLGGNTVLYERLYQEWRQAGVLDRMTLVPWQKNAATVRAYYQQSHIVVIPSLWENLPNVCLEAMMAARAVVASSVGGLAELITPGIDGEIVPPGDVVALQRTLVRLLQDLPRARQLGQSAHAMMNGKLNTTRIATQTASWYAYVIKRYAQQKPRVHVLAIVTERWVNWEKDEGVAIMVREFLRGAELDGIVARLIYRPYHPTRPVTWGRSGVLAFLRELVELGWDLTEPLRNLLLVVGRLVRRPSRFDLIWEQHSLYGLSGWVLSWVRGCPLIFNVDAPLIEEFEQLQNVRLGRVRRTVARTILRLNLARAAAIHVPSRTLAEWMVRDYGVPWKKFYVIPLGTPFETLTAPMDRLVLRQWYGVGEEPVILFVGSLQPWHGCDVLLEAFAQVHRRCPDARLLIVGDGKVRRRLETQAADLKLNGAVRFVGQVPHTRVPEFLALADVAVLPYPQLPLPFYFSPIKLFEYMGAGKAIVASRAGQIAEVLRDGETGRLVTPGSIKELAAALIDVVSSPDCGAELGRRARAVATQYTWERQTAMFASICRMVVEHRHG